MTLPPGTLTHNSIKIYEAETQRYANLLFNRTDKLLNFIFNARWLQPGYITVPSYLIGESAIIVGRRSRTDHYCTRDD